MATLVIKNFPDALYAQLKARAVLHRRSINHEAIVAIKRGLAEAKMTDPGKVLAMLRRSRAHLRGVHLTDKELRRARVGGRV